MAKTVLDLSKFATMLERAVSGKIDYRPLLKTIRVILVSGVRGFFDQSRDPEGVPWKPLKRPRYRPLRRGQKHRKRKSPLGIDKPLVDTGTLMRSVTAGGRGKVEEMTDTSITLGSNLIYAGVHNYGYPPKNIPQRQFLGISDEMETEIEEATADFVAEQIARSLSR